MRSTTLLSAATILFSLATAAGAEPITTASLVEDMIDMHELAEFPQPAYKTVQFASNDRRSDTPGGVGWFDNSDGFGNEPVPNFEKVLREPGDDKIGEYLICDVKGPGAIVRQWTAAIEGEIRVYLDGAEAPTWEGHAMSFFLRPWEIYTERFDIDDTVLDNTFYQKNAAYCPFPFARRCRVVWVGDVRKIHFYHVNVRLYEDGTDVRTFKPADVRNHWSTIRDVASVLAEPDVRMKPSDNATTTPINAVLEPEQKNVQVLEVEGSGAVEELTLKVETGDVERALRQTVMQIVFDDYPWGQVHSPIGDFFGAAPGVNPYDSVPFTVRGDGTMTCRYVMPFARSARIILDNFGEQPVCVTGSVKTVPHEWTDNSMFFRARWRIDHDLIGLENGRVRDIPYLIANGKGVYVGSACMLLNPNEVPSPGGSWWGEGDEKIFIDDDTQPSTFGTGSEDYYNYSWSQPLIWIQPYAGQPRNDGPANRGFVTNFRWHVLDPMPFEYRLSFYMELYPHERTPGMAYARIGYHYGRPGIMDDHVAITGEDVREQKLPSNWQPKARGGAGNSVFFQAEDQVARWSPTLSMDSGRLYSGNGLLVWKPESKGEQLKLNVPLEQSRKYAFYLVMRKDNQSGPVSAKINGQELVLNNHDVTDLYIPYRTILRAFRGQDIELEKGNAELVLTYESGIVRGDERTIGIDFIWVQNR